MTPKKRGRDTACVVPQAPDTTTMHDAHCERCVLAGLMREPVETLRALRDLRFVGGDFYHDTHQKLYDVLLFTHHGGIEGPLLADAFDTIRKRGGWMDGSFGNFHACSDYLVEVWDTDLWFEDIFKWGNVNDAFWPIVFPAWVAYAAAYKVKHLTTRRYAIHAANEVIRDALAPTEGVHGLDKRITQFDEDY